MNAYDMLYELCDQNQFELLMDKAGYKLVYLMNDAVESFLILHNAVMTGTYKPNYDGDVNVECSLNQKNVNSDIIDHASKYKNYIIARQGDSVVTLFFDFISLEIHLYNYGKLGHFWVPKYEYLRLLEYRLSILRDKVNYIGPTACTTEELELSCLTDFPPLNYCCYPSAPLKYIVERDNPWTPSEAALDLMTALAAESSDHKMVFLLRLYRRFSGKLLARYIAHQMHLTGRKNLVSLLDQKLKIAVSSYPDRNLGPELNARRDLLLEKAKARLSSLKAEGFEGEIVIEEPFTTAQDDIKLSVYIMSKNDRFGNCISKIDKIK